MNKKKSQPLVNVIVPAFNMELYIDRCVQSILGQSYKNIRLIIVDDGSTDNTLLKCKKWSEIDKRVNVLHQENSGVSSARNLALKNISGDFVLFVDSDDWLDSNMIKIMVEDITSKNSDVCVCGLNCINEESKSIEQTILYGKEQVLNREEAVLAVFGNLWPMVWNKLFRLSLISKEDLFHEELGIGEDELWVIQFLYKVKSVSVVNKALYNYGIRQGSLCHDYKVSKNRLSEVKAKLLVEEEIKKFNSSDSLRVAQRRTYSCCYNLMRVAYYSDNKEIYKKIEKISRTGRPIWFKYEKRPLSRLKRSIIEFMMGNWFPKYCVRLLDEKICKKHILGFFQGIRA